MIRYDYLWRHEASAGHDIGKDRPACIVAASDAGSRPHYVVILAITHRRPSGLSVGIEIPPKVKAALGLDSSASWVIVSEHNVDAWPNAGLSPVPGKSGVYAFGFIPPGLFAIIKATFLDLARSGQSEGIHR